MKMNSRETGIVHLYDLPADETYVDINPVLKKRMREVITRNYSLSEVARIGEPLHNIYYFLKGESKILLNRLYKLIFFVEKGCGLDISPEMLERNITKIGTKAAIIKPKLPFDFTKPQGARFLE